MVYRVLGRLLWKGRLGEADIVILHRGAPGDRKVIPGSSIVSVKRGYLVCKSDDSPRVFSARNYKKGADRHVTIPLHRVMEVRLEGKSEWKRKEKP